jgi:hypothetical protein
MRAGPAYLEHSVWVGDLAVPRGARLRIRGYHVRSFRPVEASPILTADARSPEPELRAWVRVNAGRIPAQYLEAPLCCAALSMTY